MSDFNAKIVAIDEAMDTLEHYRRECADLQAHVRFDMRSLQDRLEQQIPVLRQQIESLYRQLSRLRRDKRPQQELEAVREKLRKKEAQLEAVEDLCIHCHDRGRELLERFLDRCHAADVLAEDALRFMGRYIRDLNLVCNREGIYRSTRGYYVCIVDSSVYPSTAEHIRAAQKLGHPERLTLDRGGAARRREDSLRDTPVRGEFDRDEYPMAMFSQGGSGANVAYLEGNDNRGAGSSVGWQLRGIPDGARVRIRII